jgi:hypothetical protein
LSVEPFHAALLAGYLARSNCTPNDANFFPGLTQWNTTQRVLREGLAPLAWHSLNEGSYCLVENEAKTMAIVVASGDKNTGIDGALMPTTRSPKGPKTIHIVQQNAMLYHGDFFGETLPSPIPLRKDGRETWLFLLNQDGGEIRSELSLPASFAHTQDGKKVRINAWHERIILPVLDLGAVSSRNAPPEPDFGPDVKVEIRKKAK